MPKVEGLEGSFCAPSVPTVAARKKGVERIIPLLSNAVPSPLRLEYGGVIEGAISRMERLLPDATPVGKRALAIMLLCGGDSLTPWPLGKVAAGGVRGRE